MTPPWSLTVLGSPTLARAGEAARRLEGKTAALLAYLALEGTTPRTRLCALLWPESSDARARNSLRQLLHRLRGLWDGEADPVQGTDALELAPGTWVDALALLEPGAGGGALPVDAVLLGGVELEGCEPYLEWLEHARQGLEARRQRTAGAEVERLERAGELRDALALAEREWARAPLSEEAHRRLMRLHYLSGDRAAALGVYRGLERRLREQLGAAPSEQTRALAREVERGAVAAPPRPQRTGAAAARAQLPVSVLRPPVLAGREREWALLEEAWDAGRIVFLAAEAGVGKSRLAADFAATRGAYEVFEGRPGERDVAYSTGIRFVRRMLATRPHIVPSLEPWVVREVSRLMPEFLTDAGPPPPMASESERVRLMDATCELVARCTEGLGTVIIDDVHFADEASRDGNNYFLTRSMARARMGEAVPRYIVCFRPAEMPPERLAHHRALADAGLATLIELQPLLPQAVGALLEGLEVPGVAAMAQDIARYTGGNPLYVVETVKHLVETGATERGWPERLPPPGKVGPLIQSRLERLSPAALQLAQVAALANTQFDLELAGAVLDAPPVSFGPALSELEAAQVLTGERFTHDLVFETVRDAIPGALARYLHRKLAEVLERRGAAPARVAQHWLASGARARAAAPLLAAAREEEAARRFAEAAAHTARAAELLEEAGEKDLAQKARDKAKALEHARAA